MYFYSKKINNNNKKINDDNSEMDNTKSNNNLLIYKKKELSPNINFSKFILYCFLYFFYFELFTILYYLGLQELDLWVFNIIFTTLFMITLLKKPLFKHQLFSLGFTFFTNIISIISINIYYDVGIDILGDNLFFIILIYIVFVINSCLISYSRVNLKILMDLKYVSLYKIIFYIGIIGCILISMCLIITSIFQCPESSFCRKSSEDEAPPYYFDSFPIYISELKNIISNANNAIYAFWSEIIAVTPLKICGCFFECLLELLIIYYLNPIYILVSDSIYYTSLKVLNLIFYNEKEYNKEKEDKIGMQFLKVIIEIVTFLNYLIYLEIIELKFCGLDKNLKISITKRGIREIKGYDFDESHDDEEASSDYNTDNESNNDNDIGKLQ